MVKAINQTLVNHHFCLLLGAGSGAYPRGPKLSPCSQQIVPWWERQNLFNKKGHMPINTYALQTVMLLGQVRRWAGKTIGLTPWQDLQKEVQDPLEKDELLWMVWTPSRHWLSWSWSVVLSGVATLGPSPPSLYDKSPQWLLFLKILPQAQVCWQTWPKTSAALAINCTPGHTPSLAVHNFSSSSRAIAHSSLEYWCLTSTSNLRE